MLTTEKDAAAKLCCASPVRWSIENGTPNNLRCVGKKCMAWRWAEPLSKAPAEPMQDAEARQRGYCGLAGGPVEVVAAASAAAVRMAGG